MHLLRHGVDIGQAMKTGPLWYRVDGAEADRTNAQVCAVVVFWCWFSRASDDSVVTEPRLPAPRCSVRPHANVCTV